MKKALIIVDPQNDFVSSKGSLFVPGSPQAIKEICRYIVVNGNDLEDIIVSLDTHHPWHVSNSIFWKEQPAPFTKITSELVEGGTYNPAVDDEAREVVLEFMGILGDITIWPEHCILGTWGHSLPEELSEVLRGWEKTKKKQVTYQYKGTKPLFESYSLFTEEKLGFEKHKHIWMELDYDEIVISGFAKDICVAETVKAMREKEKYRGKLRFFEPGLAAIDPGNCDIYQECIDNFGAALV